MTGEMSRNSISSILCIIIGIVIVSTTVSCDDTKSIPADKSQINQWFQANVLPASQRKATLDPVLYQAESNRTVIKVRKDGSGQFKTITDALNSIPKGNSRRVIVNIGPGVYNEKITIDRTKPFVTLYAHPNSEMPTLQYAGTAKQYGTFGSGTLIVEADYFAAANIIIKNSAARPDANAAMHGAQAVALRLAGDKAAIYGCRIIGFQDTLLDEKGRHFFKGCYIEGTVDFIFGSGKSLYLKTELHVIAEKWRTVVTAQARQSKTEDSGFSFVHCIVSGIGVDDAYLGRAWMKMPEVVFSYSYIGNNVIPEGWNNNKQPEANMFFGEYQNTGPKAKPDNRAKYSTRLTQAGAKEFLNLGYVEGSKWLLPPPSI